MTLLSDLATLLAPYESGTKVPATGITIAGTDLSDLYSPVAVGAPLDSATGILVNGADVGTLFAKAGSTTKLSDDFKGQYANSDVGSGPRTASVTLTFRTDGTYTGGGRSGRWLSAGFDASVYEILISLTGGDALSTNGAGSYVALSANRSCSLTASLSGSGAAEVHKLSELFITIREIAAPTVKVEAAVTIQVSAESWGSSPYLP